jgi:hypothetical protein
LDKKVKSVLIVSLVALLLLIAALVSYKIMSAYRIGNLEIISGQSDVAYQVSGDENTFTGNHTLYFLNKGSYVINAYGLTPGIFLPKTFNVNVQGNKTTSVEIKLQIDPSGPNRSGAEGP